MVPLCHPDPHAMIFNTGRLRLLLVAPRGESSHFMTSAISLRHTTISFRIVGTRDEIFTETYESGKHFQQSFHGFRFTNPQTGFTYAASDLLDQHTDPSVVYMGRHPFLAARLEHYSHTPEITDKALEDKACRALEHYFRLRSQGTVRHNNPKGADSWRLLTGDDGKDIAEWEGIWKSPNGHVYFLEAKHLMSFVKLREIQEKLERSCLFLGLKSPNATVYLAGNHWEPDVFRVAQSSFYGFSVLTSNGQDLTVLEPSVARKESGIWKRRRLPHRLSARPRLQHPK